MNWVMGIVGAIAGVVLGQSSWVLGAVAGFFLMYLFMNVLELRRAQSSLEQELARLRLQRETAAAAPARAAAPPPAGVASPAAPAPTTATPAAPASAPESPTPGHSEPPPIPVNYASRPAAVAGDALPPGLDEAAIAAARARFAARNETVAGNGNGAAAAAPPPRAYAPRQPREPDFGEKLVNTLKSWFTEGNVPVKIGVLVLFAGVAAALRYAAAQGYFTFPIEYRLVAIAAAALAALAFGFRERERKPAFGLSLQGGAIGVLLLTVFATYKMYGLLPPTLAFALVVGLVAGAAFLAVLQKNMPLAVLGFLGGYLAPVLINTGSNNYIGLFSYYAVLNAAVFAISWKRSWRLLNIMGFLFTFGVGTAWGAENYRPDMFPTVEPFLILFFVFYVVIGLLYVIRQTEHRRPWVDGTLVFGTPLVAFPLQAKMLEDNRMGLAFSALAVALVYAGLMWFLRRRRDERLLTEAYGALALGFATLAIPLAFSAGTTATLWALEGVGVAWLGLRQNRTFPWLSGLALQVLAAGSYVIGWENASLMLDAIGTPMFLNAVWFGAVILSFSGFALSLIHDRHKPMPALSVLLFLWGTFWWVVAVATQMDIADAGIGVWTYVMASLAGTMLLATGLRAALDWLRMHWLVALASLAGMVMVFFAYDKFDAPLASGALPMWALYFAALAGALWAGRDIPSRSLSLAHLAMLWTLAMLLTFQVGEYVDDQDLAEGWRFVGICLPVMLMTFGLWRFPQVLAQPRDVAFASYRLGWLAPANLLLVLAFTLGLFFPGESAPLPYLPLINPLELGLLAILALLVAQMRESGGQLTTLFRLWPVLGFAFITMATLRAVHHWHGEPWSGAILDSGYTQTCLTLVWSLLGVGSMLIGSRRGNRPLWVGGMVLMILICAKLALIDRLYMGNTTGIVSCLGVGILLVGVGYFAPSPPKDDEGVSA